MTTTRPYESPLRAEQLEQTRLRILEATADVLADEEVEEVTVPLVAMRARVSLRTVYRHFPTKEALFDAFGEWGEEHLRLAVLSYPEFAAVTVTLTRRPRSALRTRSVRLRATVVPRVQAASRQRTQRYSKVSEVPDQEPDSAVSVAATAGRPEMDGADTLRGGSGTVAVRGDIVVPTPAAERATRMRAPPSPRRTR